MNDLVPGARVEGEVLYHGAGPLRRRRRPGRGAQPHRHGLPEAEPVPEVDLRQRRLRPARARHEGRASTSASSGRCSRRRSGTRSRTGSRRARSASPAASSSASASRAPRGRAGRDPDGRAVLGARPDLDRADRGPDARAEARVHDRDRHPQHAAGRARRRPHRVLHRRGGREAASAQASSSSTTRRRRSSRTRPTSAPRTTSRGGSDDAHRLPGGARRARGARSRRGELVLRSLRGAVEAWHAGRRARRRGDRLRRRDRRAYFEIEQGIERCSRARRRSRATCASCSRCCTSTSTSSGWATTA